jgi:hypothetical protein
MPCLNPRASLLKLFSLPELICPLHPHRYRFLRCRLHPAQRHLEALYPVLAPVLGLGQAKAQEQEQEQDKQVDHQVNLVLYPIEHR